MAGGLEHLKDLVSQIRLIADFDIAMVLQMESIENRLTRLEQHRTTDRSAIDVNSKRSLELTEVLKNLRRQLSQLELKHRD